MATTASYLAFVLEQLPPLWDVRSRKMFGEYMVYLNEKPVLLVCDNTVFVKKLPVLDDLMRDAPCGCPYEGAKEHYILDVDDREKLLRVLAILEPLIPVPQPRRRKAPKAR